MSDLVAGHINNTQRAGNSLNSINPPLCVNTNSPSGKDGRLGQTERRLQPMLVARTLHDAFGETVGHHATACVRAARQRWHRRRRLRRTVLVVAVALGRTLRRRCGGGEELMGAGAVGAMRSTDARVHGAAEIWGRAELS